MLKKQTNKKNKCGFVLPDLLKSPAALPQEEADLTGLGTALGKRGATVHLDSPQSLPMPSTGVWSTHSCPR